MSMFEHPDYRAGLNNQRSTSTNIHSPEYKKGVADRQFRESHPLFGNAQGSSQPSPAPRGVAPSYGAGSSSKSGGVLMTLGVLALIVVGYAVVHSGSNRNQANSPSAVVPTNDASVQTDTAAEGPAQTNQPVGGYAQNSPPVGGYGQASQPAGGDVQNSPPVGGYGQNSHPVDGYAQSSPPVGGYGQTSQPVGGYARSSPPVGGYGQTSQPVGGYARSSPPVGGYGQTNQPVGGDGQNSLPVGGYAQPGHDAQGQGQPQGAALMDRNVCVDFATQLDANWKQNNGVVSADDASVTMESCKRSAEGDKDPLSMLILASIYEHGIGVPQDTQQAISWYRAAAQSSDSEVASEAQKDLQRLGAQ